MALSFVSYNQIVDAFEDISTAHYQVNTFGIGDVWEVATSGTVQYPMVWAVPQDGQLSNKVYNSNWTLIFMDLVHKDEHDENEVMSDMEQVALDYIAQLQKPEYGFDFKADGISFKRFTERFDDEVTGVAIDITIRVPFIFNRCAIPASVITVGDSTGGSSGSSGTCADVSILNQLGTLIASVASGGSYSVIEFSGIDGGSSTTNYSNSIIDS